MLMSIRTVGKTIRLAAIARHLHRLPVFAAALKADTAKSSVTATFKQLNVPVDAKFKKFDAQITYDAAKPETSKATVDIDVSSFDLGDPDYNKEVLKKEWFNAAQFPKASFVSSQHQAGRSRQARRYRQADDQGQDGRCSAFR
jgi:polyisoprenoid-binding protein YceI